MNVEEKVAILTAIQKRAKEMLDELRPEMDREAMELYEGFGVTKHEVKVGGRKVADMIIPMSKEDYEIDDPESFFRFCQDYGIGHYVLKIEPERMAEAVSLLNVEHPELVMREWKIGDWKPGMTPDGEGATWLDSGMPVPGVRRIPPQPKKPTLRGIKWREVAQAAGAIPGGLSGLLEGGEDE